MKNFNEFIERMCKENYERGFKRGLEYIVADMLKKKISDDYITKVTKITKEELEKIKLKV